MLLLFMLLLSCNKASNLRVGSLKTFEEDQKKGSERDINYVIGKDNDDNDNKEIKKEQHVPDIQMNYLEQPALLDILNKDKKDFDKVQKNKDEYQELDIDYSESKTLLDILDEEKKSLKSFENENSYKYDSSYGYEKTVGYEDDFFC